MNETELAILRNALLICDEIAKASAERGNAPSKTSTAEGLRRILWLQSQGRADLHVVHKNGPDRLEIDDADEEALFKVGAP